MKFTITNRDGEVLVYTNLYNSEDTKERELAWRDVKERYPYAIIIKERK